MKNTVAVCRRLTRYVNHRSAAREFKSFWDGMTTKETHEGRGGQEFKGNLERNNVREPVQWEVVWLEVPGSSEFSRSFGVPGLLR